MYIIKKKHIYRIMIQAYRDHLRWGNATQNRCGAAQGLPHTPERCSSACRCELNECTWQYFCASLVTQLPSVSEWWHPKNDNFAKTMYDISKFQGELGCPLFFFRLHLAKLAIQHQLWKQIDLNFDWTLTSTSLWVLQTNSLQDPKTLRKLIIHKP